MSATKESLALVISKTRELLAEVRLTTKQMKEARRELQRLAKRRLVKPEVNKAKKKTG
jgi:hypothetical protein